MNSTPEQTEIEQTTEERNQLLTGYGLVFNELLKSPTFTAFLALHYTIQKVVNDEEHSVEIRVIENPPDVVMQKLQESGLMQRPDQSKIEVVSPSKAAKVVKLAEARAKQNKKR